MIDIPPRTAEILMKLYGREISCAQVARETKTTIAYSFRALKFMKKNNLAFTEKLDGRTNLIILTAKGEYISKRLSQIKARMLKDE